MKDSVEDSRNQDGPVEASYNYIREDNEMIAFREEVVRPKDEEQLEERCVEEEEPKQEKQDNDYQELVKWEPTKDTIGSAKLREKLRSVGADRGVAGVSFISAPLHHKKQAIAYPKAQRKKLLLQADHSSLGVDSQPVSVDRPSVRGLRKNQGRKNQLQGSSHRHRISLHGLGKNQPNGSPHHNSSRNSRRRHSFDGSLSLRGLRMNQPKGDTAHNGRNSRPRRRHTVTGGFIRNSNQALLDEEELEIVVLPEEELENEITVNQANSLDQGGHHPAITGLQHNDNNDLVEAMPVEEDAIDSADLMEAQPVERESLHQREVKEANDKRYKRLACCFVSIAIVILTVSLASALHNKTESKNVADTETLNSYGPNVYGRLPPMENLELLYTSLPEETRESLYDSESPQYEAWKWLFHHPIVSSLEEWRKKQIFALATFFYSFEGPTWPESTRKRWMDVNTSECSWILSDAQVHFIADQMAPFFGTVYRFQELQPCNKDGKLQTLFVQNLPTTVKSSIPPEIGLLTSLRTLAFYFCQFSSKLSDLMVPQLLQLPSLSMMTLYGTGLGGTIPEEMGLMTNLRHLFMVSNNLSGTIPTEMAKMTSLELFFLSEMKGFNGWIPSQLGLMTRLTMLGIYQSSFSGLIPSEFGLLTRVTWLDLDANALNGSVPTELGMLTSIQTLFLKDNALTGLIPTELGLMTNAIELWLGNDLELPGPHNNFYGSLPGELWDLSQIKKLFLPNLPNLVGSIPKQLKFPNLTMLSLGGSPGLAGTIPEHICIIQELDFDCTDVLCGCDCECVSTANQTSQLQVSNPSLP